jgi:hypothetical protein
VKAIADTRHHHKRPLYFNIPRYDGSLEQKKLAKLAKECKIVVEKYITTTNKITMQEISALIKDNLMQIKNVGLKILLSREGQKVIKEYDLEA